MTIIHWINDAFMGAFFFFVTLEIIREFLHGELSNYVNKKDYELINYHYNNASIIEVPDSGHWLHADNPNFFLEKTINFLNS